YHPLLCYPTYSVSSQSPSAHTPLHSFPTRRSSDLTSVVITTLIQNWRSTRRIKNSFPDFPTLKKLCNMQVKTSILLLWRKWKGIGMKQRGRSNVQCVWINF